MSETFTPRKARAGDFPVVTRSETLLSGQNCAEMSVLGRITASGKLVICNSGGTDDGRRTPYGVLLEACDASSEDKVCVVALTGEFDENGLVFGGTDTVETHRDALRLKSIFPKTSIAA